MGGGVASHLRHCRAEDQGRTLDRGNRFRRQPVRPLLRLDTRHHARARAAGPRRTGATSRSTADAPFLRTARAIKQRKERLRSLRCALLAPLAEAGACEPLPSSLPCAPARRTAVCQPGSVRRRAISRHSQPFLRPAHAIPNRCTELSPTAGSAPGPQSGNSSLNRRPTRWKRRADRPVS